MAATTGEGSATAITTTPPAATAARDAGGAVAAGLRERISVLAARLVRYLSRPHWWIEILLVWSIYQAYSYVRNLGGKETAPAMLNGEHILDIEKALHIDVELTLNRWLHDNPWLENLAALHYHTLHWWVTIGVAVWLYCTNRPGYRRASLVLALTTIIALVGFYLIPTAPPRMFDGYLDTMSYTSSWGWWGISGSPGPESITNEVAAMPSLHCGWAIWAGMMIALYARRRWLRVLGILYPMTTVFVVMATANHYLLDVVAIMVVLAVAMAVVYAPWHLLWGRLARLRRNRDDSGAVVG